MRKHMFQFVVGILVIAMSFPSTLVLAVENDLDSITVASLQELQDAIKTAGSGETIYITQNIELTSGCLIGGAPASYTLSALPGEHIVFSMSADLPETSFCVFENVTLHNISIEQHGGATMLQFVDFNRRTDDTKGSSLSINAGTATIHNCCFEGGQSNYGSHIYIDTDASVSLSECQFVDGLAYNDGGSIYSLGHLVMANSSVTSCSSIYGNGGGIYSFGTLDLRKSTIDGCTAKYLGGNVFALSAQITDCIVSNGTAGQDGGGLYLTESSQIVYGRITQNNAGGCGGGIRSGSDLTIDGCLVFDNTAILSGADIATTSNLTITTDLEEYLSIFNSIYDNKYTSILVFSDREEDKYSSDNQTEQFAVPCYQVSEDVCLIFVPFEDSSNTVPGNSDTSDNTSDEDGVDEEPLSPPDSGSENQPTQNPGPSQEEERPSQSAPPAPPRPSTSHHTSTRPSSAAVSQSTVPVEPSKPLLKCNGAIIDISAVTDFCSFAQQFIPEHKPLSRGEMAWYICTVLGKDSAIDEPEADAFSDIAASPFREAINTLAAAGVVSGCGGGVFAPDAPLTVAQLITMLTRFTSLRDADLHALQVQGHWAEANIKTAVAIGWIADTNLDVNTTATVADLVAVLTVVASNNK